MRIEIIRCLQDNYSYLLIDDAKGIGCVVDPGEAAPSIKYVESNNIELKYILNTHHQIGRAHVRTPVTSQSRMPSSA